jgi:hypothetical protein
MAKISLRSAVITGVAVVGGSVAGTAAQALEQFASQPLPGVVPLVTFPS